MIFEGFTRALGDALEGFANWYGLGNQVKKIISGPAPSYEEVQSVIDEIVTEALSNNDTKISELESRLNNLPFSISPSIKSKVNAAKQRMKNELNNLKVARASAQTKIDQARSLVNDIPTMSLGDRVLHEYDGKMTKARDIADKAVQLLQNPTVDNIKNSFTEKEI